jgi:arylformamidase
MSHCPARKRGQVMAAIDYETEYDNRTRVPEHPQIFEQWTRDGAAYRGLASTEKRAELGLRYGAGPRQTVDLFHAAVGAAAPLAMFIHGGWWRSLEASQFSQMAAGLNARGVSVAVVGYDFCPQVSIATIIDQMRAACLFVWRRLSKPMLVCGHSAGGHLAAAMLATDWKAIDPAAPARLVPAAYSVSGVFDLTPMVGISVNQDLRLDVAQARAVSPLFWPAPRGSTFDSVVGELESAEFLRQARSIVDTWGQAGVATRYGVIAAKNHFTVIDALTDADSTTVTRLVELSPRG